MTGGYFRITDEMITKKEYNGNNTKYTFYVIAGAKKLCYEEDYVLHTTKLFVYQGTELSELHPTRVITGDIPSPGSVDPVLLIIRKEDFPDIANDLDPEIIGEVALMVTETIS